MKLMSRGCIYRLCHSPTACAGFGACRGLNFIDVRAGMLVSVSGAYHGEVHG